MAAQPAVPWQAARSAPRQFVVKPMLLKYIVMF
jgi:hypothetical protein